MGSVSLRGDTYDRLLAWCKANGTTTAAAWLADQVDRVSPAPRPSRAWCPGPVDALTEVDSRGRSICPKCGRLIGSTRIGRSTKTPQRYRMLRHRVAR